MCDYSLMHVPNRLAVEGEKLVTTRFGMVIGLASKSNLRCAVCIPPGASLLLQNIPKDIRRTNKVGPIERVKFDQFDYAQNTFRDGVVFRNGKKILLQDLDEGMEVEVLSLQDTTERRTERSLFTFASA